MANVRLDESHLKNTGSHWEGVMKPKIGTKACGLQVGVTTTEPPCGGCRAAL